MLGLKTNQPTLLTHVSQRLLAQPAEQVYTRWAFAGDGTPVQYQVWASGELGWVDEDGRWPRPGTAGANYYYPSRLLPKPPCPSWCSATT